MSKMKLVAVSIVTVALIILSINVMWMGNVSAQSENNDDMQSLLETLSKRMDDGTGFRFFITFVHPLVGDESTWVIGDPADKLFRRIIETGKDYVCFREIGGAADGRRCTPFSNIISVEYLNN